MPFIPGNSASLSLLFPDCQQEGIFVRSDNIDENEKKDLTTETCHHFSRRFEADATFLAFSASDWDEES